ncbi:MAG TPA: phosphotransferase [Nocardioidaceae bacterium]|nr:phosphotransferase [Nocardioidaceae bacterium]
MREPPAEIAVPVLLDTVRRAWDADVATLTHLPIGFGAHHWCASREGRPGLFVTFDRLPPKRDADELEAAYAAAGSLRASGLGFVLAGRAAASGSYTVPLAGGAVSVTDWVDGVTGDGPPVDAREADECAAMLALLHQASAPTGTPLWRPLLDPATFLDDLARLVETPWRTGPYGEPVRQLLRDRLTPIRGWANSYGALARQALSTQDTWVVTHGEPDTGNQIVTATGRFLVDWESVKLAPRERDLRGLIDSGFAWEAPYGISAPDWAMVEMFDLEWRLSEVVEYAAWFSHEHHGSASDRVAFEGLREELERAEWVRP